MTTRDENYRVVRIDHCSLIHSRYGSDLVRTGISFLKRCFQPKRWFLDSYLERIINQLKQFVTFDIHVLERIHFDKTSKRGDLTSIIAIQYIFSSYYILFSV